MSNSYSIKPITEAVQHGEGPHWDHGNQILYFVDTFKATIYRWNFCSDHLSSYKLENHNSVAIVIPIKDKEDELLVASDRDVFVLKWPNKTKNDYSKTHTPLTLAKLEREKPKNQFNDGKVDSKGRLWLGTLTRNEDLSVSSNGGSLYMLAYEDGMKEIERISNTSISNGLAWSQDNKRFYHIDSSTRMVVGYDYHEESGEISNKKIIFDLKDHPNLEDIPDGMTIDENDHLWIALFGGHSVINVDPASGELMRVIEVPVTYVTSVCFGGPDLDILYATTSRLHLDREGLEKEPMAGRILAIEHLGVKGLPSREPALLTCQ
ncbi:unnamed protein product [Phaedon cochleariae]|uniref:Regucalcin n=1 Tax=Phaedon cochleariae TaxID=80249 RepID=A0A9P0DEA8_PHACE|nr:unnamed protein product [Phaedon cochleariae]